jgi:hypothetical protein
MQNTNTAITVAGDALPTRPVANLAPHCGLAVPRDLHVAQHPSTVDRM